MTRIFLVAGESSGDIHGGNLVRALRELDPSVECSGLGGRHMAEAGMALRYDLASDAIMGFVEVARRFPWIRRIFLDTIHHLEADRPDCLVLIDYPGFNMQLARRAALLSIPIVYYISPQVWAWKKNRIYRLAEMVLKMLVILPFEEALYREVGMDVTYVGHPLFDHMARYSFSGSYDGGMAIGLLPGSREQEIGRLMGTMLEVAKGIRARHPEARFVTPCVDEARQEQIRAMAGGFPLETVVGKSYDVLKGARFCLLASGTATLEAALFGVPMLITYKVAPLSYLLARLLVHIEHIGLVNILAGRRIVPEFVQGAATAEALLPAALELIEDSPARRTMLQELAKVRDQLGGAGASKRAAEEVLKVAHEAKSHG